MGTSSAQGSEPHSGGSEWRSPKSMMSRNTEYLRPVQDCRAPDSA